MKKELYIIQFLIIDLHRCITASEFDIREFVTKKFVVTVPEGKSVDGAVYELKTQLRQKNHFKKIVLDGIKPVDLGEENHMLNEFLLK